MGSKMCWKAMFAAVAVACTGVSALAQSTVGNPGFENPLMYDLPAPAVGEWTAFFGGPGTSVLAAEQSTVAPRTGLNALHLKVANDGNAFCGVQQPISGLQPNVQYTFKIWARKAGNINNAVEYRIEWKNAAGAFIGDQFALTTNIASQLTNTYQQFTLTATSPAGAANANLVLAVQSFTFNPVSPVFDTEVYIDDVTFSATSSTGQAACCLSDGSCTVAAIGACPSGATQQSPGSTCSPNNCPAPQIGACCNRSTAACVVVDVSVCTPLGGLFRGAGTTCSPNLCTVTPVCRADFNGQGGVTVQDIFDFLSAWFAGCP